MVRKTSSGRRFIIIVTTFIAGSPEKAMRQNKENIIHNLPSHQATCTASLFPACGEHHGNSCFEVVSLERYSVWRGCDDKRA